MQQSSNFSDTLFSKIVQKKIPSEMLYQDEYVSVFKDKFPQALVHFLVVPNKIIASLNDTTAQDALLLGKMMTIAVDQAKKCGLEQTGYRIIINTGHNAGQEIMHLHLHVLGGELLNSMQKK